MVEIIARSLKEILNAFPPEEEKISFIDKEKETREVVYRVSRLVREEGEEKGKIVYAVPEAEWLKIKREEQQENQATV